MKGRIVVIGGGGHARVVLELLVEDGWEVAGYTDPLGRAADVLGAARWLGNDAALPQLLEAGVRHAFVAVGDNAMRGRLADQARRMGFQLPNAVHASARLSASARLGSGIALMAQTAVNAGAVVGDNAVVNTGATIDHDCTLGRDVHIAPGVHVAGRVTIGDRALVGVGSAVGRGRPLTVGADAVIGSGSVVIGDVPPGAVVAGNPARPLAGRGRR